MPAKEDIDRIVSEVLRRLALSPEANASPSAQARTSLRVSEGVVSLSAVEGRLEQVRQLVVPHRSIVTPAVRDVLKTRDIELVRCHGGVADHLATCFIVGGTCSASIERLLAELPGDVRLLGRSPLSETISTMAAQLGQDNTLGLVVTEAPEAAVCLANRNAQLRAVWGLDEANVKRAVSTIAANLLIIPSLEKSLFETRRLVRAFLNTPRQIDDAFQAVLSRP